ncbi:MAG: lipoprotein-releasing ABC transporter permease subunit [Alphaproteobacteria bacterium]|nr:lipoprotein-releasing ABC transporter permease subunit [Alphaproteobacteria bacterium]
MFSKFERFVACRYLRAKRKEGFISVITSFAFVGIALGVATLIIVTSVMNGFKAELLGRILGINGHISIASLHNTNFNNYLEAIKTLENQVIGVDVAIPLVEKQLLATAGNSAEGVMIRGIRANDIQKKQVLRDGFKDFDLNFFKDDVVVLGYKLANKLGVMEGDEITLLSPQGKITMFGTVPRMKSYRVAGTFNFGMYEYDANFIFMPLEATQKFFSLGDSVSSIDVTLRDDVDIDYTRELIRNAVESSGNRAFIYDYRQTNSAFFNAIDVERNVMFLILTLIILVAAFNIITGLIMLVKDKGRDIAVLRTMGATKGAIMRIFFLDGAYIGVVGTALGVILGLLFCDNIENIRQFLQSIAGRDLFAQEIYFLSKLPAKVETDVVVSVGVISLLLSFIATLYPAYRAAKMDPVEALRYE